MAEQGLGIAYLPDFAIGRQLREGLLVTVLDDYTDRSGPLRVLWPSSRHLSPKLRVFVDFLAANLVRAVDCEADRAGDPRDKFLRFFADGAAKKWPLRGSLKLAIGCL
jgi:hypothetical protein